MRRDPISSNRAFGALLAGRVARVDLGWLPYGSEGDRRMSARKDWIEARSDPCPVCGRKRRCKRHRDHGADLVLCFRRSDEVVSGYRLLKTNGVCSTYVLVGSPADRSRSDGRRDNNLRPHSTNRRPTCHDDIAQRFARQITDEQIQVLGNQLGVTVESLRAIRVGRTGKYACFPEVNDSGHVVGINQRCERGSGPRYMVRKGDQRGLIVPVDLNDRPDPVLIVEGPSDTAAGLTMGLTAIGRPNDKGGGAYLVKLLKNRAVIVVGENDEKHDGRWPGRDGARHIAQILAMEWGREVAWSLPPDGVKDVREYLGQHLGGDALETGRGLLDHLQHNAHVEKPSSKPPEFHFTDLGNAERLVHVFGEDIRYSDSLGWLVWNGRFWEPDRSGRVETLAKQTVRCMYRDAARLDDDSKRGELAKWARNSEARKRIDDMIRLARSDPAVRIDSEGLDSDPWLLNVKNGTIDLRTGDLHQHDREDLITRCCPVRYDPSAEAHRWTSFLNEILGRDEQMIEFLRRAVGYSLTGDTSERCLFMLYGTGCNGKSTFLHTIRMMLGEYAVHARAETILAKRGDAVPCDLARLKGARFVTITEIEEGRRMDIARVKEMTGGTDPITARFMRQNEFTFMPEFKPWIATNHRPVIRDDTDAIWDRIYMVPFIVRVTQDRVDKQLPEKLLGELPGILRWAVEGCLAWEDASGLQPPEQVLAAKREYRKDMDTLEQWLEERCVTGLDSLQARGGQLWDDYREWCKRMDVRPMGHRKFGERLTERFRKEKGAYVTYYGVGLRAEA